MSIDVRAIGGIGTAIIVLSVNAGLSAAELPAPPQDQRLAAVYAKARALFEQASASGFMTEPDSSKPWPCPVPDFTVRQLVGALSSDELKALPGSKNVRMSSNSTSTVRDVKYEPISASCKNGKLDGALEVLVDYTSATDTPQSILESKYRVRKKLIMSAGEYVPGTPTSEVRINYPLKSTYKDPSKQQLMQQSSTLDSQSSWSASYSETKTPGKAGDFFIVGITESQAGSAKTWRTSFSYPTEKGSIVDGYDGAVRSSTMHFNKKMQIHGEFIIYPRNGSAGQTMCYEEGEQIKTTDCTVD